MGRKTGRTKTQVRLSVDSDLWSQAEELKEKYPINWSNNFENLIRQVIAMIKDLEETVQKSGSTSAEQAKQIALLWMTNQYTSMMINEFKEDYPPELGPKFLAAQEQAANKYSHIYFEDEQPQSDQKGKEQNAPNP